MATQLFVNLPVKDLNKSIAFFTALGYSFDPQFTDENATCMVIAENIYAMLLVEPFFKSFLPKDTNIADSKKTIEVLNCLMLDSREGVDDLVRKAVAAGGTLYKEPQDYGFMYSHGYQDLDGHIWEVGWMDPNAGKEKDAQ